MAGDPRVRLVYLFGSAVDPGRRAVRDVDLAVWTEPPLTLDERLGWQADLRRETALPVDLVLLNDASIALAHEVAQTGVCLYARDPDAEATFVTRARARYWDFRPFVDAQWRLAAERLAERLGGP